MKSITLKRISTNSEGTYGVLLSDTYPFAVTLELPWKDNLRNVSCIPAGMYLCQRIRSPRFGETFDIPVAGRSHILFHTGNWDTDTEGCILVGEQFEYLNGKMAVAVSHKGFDEFMSILDGKQEFHLTIVWL